jgi:hypothetical protein
MEWIKDCNRIKLAFWNWVASDRFRAIDQGALSQLCLGCGHRAFRIEWLQVARSGNSWNFHERLLVPEMGSRNGHLSILKTSTPARLVNDFRLEGQRLPALAVCTMFPIKPDKTPIYAHFHCDRVAGTKVKRVLKPCVTVVAHLPIGVSHSFEVALECESA